MSEEKATHNGDCNISTMCKKHPYHIITVIIIIIVAFGAGFFAGSHRSINRLGRGFGPNGGNYSDNGGRGMRNRGGQIPQSSQQAPSASPSSDGDSDNATPSALPSQTSTQTQSTSTGN